MTPLRQQKRAGLRARLVTGIIGLAVTVAACGGDDPASDTAADAPRVSTTAATAASAPSSSLPEAPPTEGRWNGSWKSTKYPIQGTFVMDLAVAAGVLSGEITVEGSDCITKGVMAGKVDGNTISFGAIEASNSVAYTGTISGASMSGTYATPCGDDQGTWTAAR